MIDLLQPDAAAGIAAIVFDLDGTLYVNRPFGREIMRCVAEYVASLRGVSVGEADGLLRETKKRLAETTGWEASLTEACRQLGGDVREMHRRFCESLVPEDYLSPDPQVIRLLKRLGARFELCLYTNNNRSLSSRILRAMGCDGLFPRIFTIEESWEPKPDPATLNRLLREMGRRPEECLFVGDRYDIDLRLPEETGCRVYPSRTIDDLLRLNALTIEE